MVQPRFFSDVKAGPRMDRLKDEIGQPWANHYKLSEHELKMCSSCPAILAGRGLGFLLPDS